MTNLIATVVVPTTGDRGLILPLSIGSILRQSVKEIEVFIIGDGVSDATRKTILQLQTEDDRIHFFDHPKHPRRGEVYRHEALKEAKGEIVVYSCDRDLLLPEHVETMYQQLQQYDIVATAHYKIPPDHEIIIGRQTVPFGPIGKPDSPLKKLGAFKLTSIGHTLCSYRRLPHGWRTTPEDQATDRYMWRQFLAQPDIRMLNHPVPTFLYFKRGRHPGMSTPERKVELMKWDNIIRNPKAWEHARLQAMTNTLNARLRQPRNEKYWVAFRGQKPLDFIRTLPQKLANRLQKLKEPPQW